MTTIGRRVRSGVALTEYRAEPVSHETPLVLVHGGVHGSWAWSNVQGWFAERGWSSTALDWFGHGESDPLPVEDMVRRGIPDVAEEIGVACASAGRPPVLVGHSVAGMIMFDAARPTPHEGSLLS